MNDPQPLVQDRLSRNSWGLLGTQGHILGMDIGSYGIRTALIDLHSHTYHSSYCESSATTASALLDDSLQAARGLLDQQGVEPKHLVRIGVGFAGPVDARRGVVQLSPRIAGWEQFPLKERVEEAFGAVTLLDNDANLIALAEATFGIGRDIKDLFYLHLSSGVGGGLVLDGRLYQGAKTMAGEIGHTPVGSIDPIHPNEPPRTLEQHLSIQGIVRRASELGLRTDRLSEIFGAPQVGPQITTEIADMLAVRIAQIIGLIDPQMIILGGVVTRSGGDALLTAIEDRVHSYLGALIDRPLEIVQSVLGFESVAIGGVALALESMDN